LNLIQREVNAARRQFLRAFGFNSGVFAGLLALFRRAFG